MPFIAKTSKEEIELQSTIIAKLEEKCASCTKLLEESVDSIWTYSVVVGYRTDDGPAIVAIAKYGNIYAIYEPEYLTEEQLVVYEFLIRDVESKDRLIVFSKRGYDAIKKYDYNKRVNVELYV